MKSRKPASQQVALMIAALLAIVLVPTPATSAGTAQSCVVYLEPIGPPNAVGEVPTQPVDRGCYPSIPEALTATGATLDGAGLAPDATVVIGIEWDNTGYSGPNTTYETSGGCTSTRSWTVAYVGNFWNDRFESGKGFSGCNRNRKYEHSQFGGALLPCTPNCSTYGVLRNEVSSLKWLH
jgi:hypothetical protein